MGEHAPASTTEAPPDVAPGRARRRPLQPDDDIAPLSWAAKQFGVSMRTIYAMAKDGQVPGAFRARGTWRVSKPKFLHEVHGGTD